MIPPKFDRDDLCNIIETHPPNSPAYMAAMRQMLDMLPEADQERFQQEAMEILGNPEPDGYDINGQPIYTAETMARCSGIPLADIETHCQEYEQVFGKVQVDPKVSVLKQPEIVYELSPEAVVLVALQEWAEANPVVVPMLDGWFELAIKRGLKPIVVHQLKALLSNADWTRGEVEPYLKRIYQHVSANEFVINFMRVKPA